MKLRAEIEGETHALELRQEGARVFAEIDGRRYELEAREPEAGIYLLTHGRRVFECRVGGAQTPDAPREVSLRKRSYSITLVNPRQLRGARSASGQDAGRAQVRAAMPGKVVRVLVEVGAEVEAGDGLLIVEAMKMQNEMKSPKTGRVVELHAAAGATVNAGEVLVVVE